MVRWPSARTWQYSDRFYYTYRTNSRKQHPDADRGWTVLYKAEPTIKLLHSTLNPIQEIHMRLLRSWPQLTIVLQGRGHQTAVTVFRTVSRVNLAVSWINSDKKVTVIWCPRPTFTPCCLILKVIRVIIYRKRKQFMEKGFRFGQKQPLPLPRPWWNNSTGW